LNSPTPSRWGVPWQVAALSDCAMKTILSTRAAPEAIGPYSQAIRADLWVFLSGQIPLDPATGQLVSGDVSAQTERVLQNLSAVLAAANCDPSDVVRTTIYLVDLAHFAAVNDVYGRHFKAPHPARSTVQVAALPRGAQVEIDAVAFIGRTGRARGAGAKPR
jgi:2-iminobutanoate/2-iminopropanoate deaminase